MSVWAILAAAGSGERLGLDRPKAFAPLNDRPLVAEPLERLDASEWVEGIVIAAPPEWEGPGGLVAETIDREGLVTAQTPQAFVASALRDAFSTLQQTVTKSTDCASLVESNGGRVRAVEGDPRLLKVTTPADLALVASWL